ncbi:2'-5'-RNA ligase [mine drainage metagenome]|uniref:2'-5'-RNA ligase n=1 Tax=mine drainage metagenome TaxID=410659 RepID=A0A1J5TIR5_9ZZZZ
MARIFLAIDLPDPIRDDLSAHAEPSHALAWTPHGQLHLTLRFLGERPRESLETLAAALSGIRVEPFLLALGGCGTFPPGEPAQVLWVGVGDGHPRLHQLRQRIDDTLLREGIPYELRSFQPHVTLARLRRGHPANVFQPHLHRLADYASAPFRVRGFGIYESIAGREGVVHQLIATTSFQPIG